MSADYIAWLKGFECSLNLLIVWMMEPHVVKVELRPVSAGFAQGENLLYVQISIDLNIL